MIPVNKDKHWSLCAVYNAALVDTFVEGVGKEVPFMLFLHWITTLEQKGLKMSEVV